MVDLFYLNFPLVFYILLKKQNIQRCFSVVDVACVEVFAGWGRGVCSVSIPQNQIGRPAPITVAGVIVTASGVSESATLQNMSIWGMSAIPASLL